MSEPGIHLDMPEETYHRLPYLSSGVIRAFGRSPMDAWTAGGWNYEHDEPTRAQRAGSARHCLILEGREALERKFCPRPTDADYPDALRTIPEIKDALRQFDVKLTGDKSELIDRLTETCKEAGRPAPEIADVLVRKASEENRGKTFVERDDWDEMLAQDKLFGGDYGVPRPGLPEVTLIWDMEGVRCKARIDWLAANEFWDVKNFNNSRGRELEDCITSKICYEGIHIQMVWYSIGIREVPKVIRSEAKAPLDIVNGDVKQCVILFLQTDVPNMVPREFDCYESFNLAQFAREEIRRALDQWRQWMAQGYERPWGPVHERRPVSIEHVPVSFLS